jgi:hypothetical protein
MKLGVFPGVGCPGVNGGRPSVEESPLAGGGSGGRGAYWRVQATVPPHEVFL